MKRLGIALLILGGIVSARAADAQEHSPYAAAADREIKALSASETEGYLTGEGMGFALAAELNGYPGPRHVLDAAEELGVTDAQQRQLEDVFARMNAEAVRLGAAIVEKERELDELFASGRATPTAVRKITVEIGDLDGELRGVHLLAHIRASEILDAEQVTRYNHLRGYRHHVGHPGR